MPVMALAEVATRKQLSWILLTWSLLISAPLRLQVLEIRERCCSFFETVGVGVKFKLIFSCSISLFDAAATEAFELRLMKGTYWG